MNTRGGFLGRSRTTAASLLFALLVAAPLVSFTPAIAGPTDLSLVWNANTDPDLAGYQIAWGSSPGSHPNLIDAGNVTAYTVTGLTTGNTYYFVVQAYDRARNFSSNSSEASGVAGAAPILTLTAGESPDPVQAGAGLTYTLSYANTGAAGATSVVVTDTIPANTTFVSANAGGVLSGSTVTWNLGSVAAGGSGSVQLVAHVASPLASGTTITNGSAAIDSAQTSPVTAAAATTTVSSAPILAISKTDGPDPVAAGANLTYTISWSNTGNMNASGVVVTDTIPANTTFVSATAGGTRSGSVVTWSVGALNAGTSGSAQLVVMVNSPLANGTTISNTTYAIDSNETSPAAGATVTTTVTATPVLTISKTDGPDPVLAGANLTYTISWSNTGNMDATSLVVTDTVPANTTFVSATAGGTESGGVVTWTAASLAAGGSGSAQMVVRVTSPLASGTTLTNSGYTADCAETAPVTGAAVTTTVTSAPVLTIAGADAPDPVAAGSDLTWTLSYANNGNADATSVVLSDTLPANTTFVSASNGGTRSGSVITWNLGTLTPGGSGSVQLVAHVTSPLANGTVINHATYSIDSAQTNPVNGAVVTTTVVSAPALTLSQTDAPDPVNAGSNLTYTLTYSNTGNANATGTVLSEPLPANTTYVTSSPLASVSGGTVTWTLGTVAGGVSGSVSLTVWVASPLANGTLLTSAPTIDCAETAPVAASPITTVVDSAPAWSLTITDSPDPVAAGANLTYAIGIANNGSAGASSTVLTAAVPANTTFVSATAGGTAAAGTVTWSLGAVNVGASSSVQMVVRVASPLANGTTLTSGALSIDCAETTPTSGPTITTTVTSAPTLSLGATDAPDPVAAGSDLTWTLTYGNNGNADATGVVISDTLPANTTFVSASNGGTRSGSVVTWNLATLTPGASGSVQLVAHVTSPLANGTVINHATYSIDSAQTNPVNGAAVTTTVVSAPALTLSQTDAPDPVNAGSNLTYTFAYSNGGNAGATAVVLSEPLPANTTYVSSAPVGTVSAGTVTWNLGTVAGGASGSVTLTVKVVSPLANGTQITSAPSIDCAETTPVAAAPIATAVGSSPVLNLTITDSPDPVASGANLTYTIGIANNGNANASSTALTALVPANTTFVSATAGGTSSAGTVTWNLGAVNVGASTSVQLVVRVASPLANGTTLTSGALSIDCAETAAVSGPTITTAVTSAPALSLGATDAPDPVQAGSNLTWTLAYANSGTADATAVVISDTLPANTTFVSATGGGVVSGAVVTWNLGPLPAGGSGAVSVTARVTSPLDNGTLISHGTYSIDSAQTIPVNGAAVTTTVASAPALSLGMTGTPDPVNSGATITYALSYSNTGNMNATSTVLTDALPANTTFVSATGGGTASAGAVTWSLGTLNGGATGSVNLVVRVVSPLADGTVITNAGESLDSAQTTPVSAASVATTVRSSPTLGLTLTDSPDPVASGANLTYTIGYGNTGSANASSAVLTAAVPANTTFVSATAGGTSSAGTVTWNLGTVNVGASISVQMVVRVVSPLANGTTLTSGALSIDCAETAAVSGPTVTTAVTSAPALSLGATDAPDPVQAGSNLTWTLAYANNGTADATAVVISDTLPANTTFVSATGGGVVSGAVVTWSLGSLQAGSSGSVSVTARVASPLDNGTLISHGTYSIDSAQTSPVSGTAVTTMVASAPVLSLGMTGTPDPVNSGATITYTLSYSNTGNMNATSVVLTDPVPPNTTFVSATGGGTASAGAVTWSLGTLNGGATGSVNLVVRVVSPLADGTVITNAGESLDSAQTTPVSAPNVQTTVRSSPTLGLTLTDGPDPVQAGANLTYTLGYSNTGSASATGTTLTATIPANTTFVSATGGGTRSGSTVTWSLGTLAVGTPGSVQMVVQVTSPLANGTSIGAGPFSLDCAETAAVASPSVTTTVTSVPALSLAQTDSPDPVAAGATLTYTLSYGNSGNANATSVVITDTIPASTVFVSATGGGALSGGVVTWAIGTVAAGGSGSVQMVVRVQSPLNNGTTLQSGNAGIDCAETAPVSGPLIATTVTSSPSLSVTASDGPDPVGAGMNLTYTLTYANGGNAVASGTILSAGVPADTTFVSASNGGVYTAGTVNWSLGTLSTNVFGTVTFTVHVVSPLPNGTTITLGTYAIDSNQTASVPGPPITTTVSSSPVLTLQVTDAPDPVLASNTLTYTLAYANTGNSPADGVVVTASVPANTTFVSTTGGATLSGSQVTWDLGTLNAGTGGSVQLVVQVSPTATSGSIITASGWSIDSNDTSPVTAAAANTSVTEGSAPTISAAVEVVTNSIYIVRGTTQFVRLTGSSFLNGAVLNLSPDITAGTPVVSGGTSLTAPLTIANGATLGPRTVTLTNPDNKMGSKADALRVVKKSDINNDCRADGVDLNALARAWNDATSDAGYNPTVDYDGDGYVGPDDLAIFVMQFGHQMPGCP